MPELEPRMFSFNSPIGACKSCLGLGIIHEWPWKEGDAESWKAKYPEFFDRYAQEKTCAACTGKRLNKFALAITIDNHDIYSLGQLSIKDLLKTIKNINFTQEEKTIAQSLLTEIVNRLTFLDNVGLGYLSLNRTARTLSGGEGQRIRLATQI